MAARRARRSKKNGNRMLVPIVVGVAAVAVLAVVMGVPGVSAGRPGKEPTENFRISDYRYDGSRFASPGNAFVFEGRVESIEPMGNDRLISISMNNNVDERLPLLVPAEARVKENLTRGDNFRFEVTCRSGLTADGEPVKGVMIVTKVETR